MNIDDYREYISAETMMGPNCVRILAELFEKYRRSVKMRTIFFLKKTVPRAGQYRLLLLFCGK